MRDYGVVSPKFWIGETGKKLRGDRDAQVLAIYLMTGPHAISTGVYHCPKVYMAHETGLPIDDASKALQRLIEAHFCGFDEASEWVFVYQMARFQIGETVAVKDKRHKWLVREVENMPKSLRHKFLSIYGFVYEIQGERDDLRAIEATSKPLRSQDHGQDQEQDQDHGQDQEQSTPAGAGSVPRGTDPPESDSIGQEAARVFAHWREVWGHPRANLDAKRRKLIRDRLRDYSEADLCQCITGYRNSPHHMGRNDRHTVYDDIGLFLRDAAHVDAGLKFYAEPPRTDLSAKTQRVIDQTQGWQPPEMRHAAN
jgi:hypothetical protein